MDNKVKSKLVNVFIKTKLIGASRKPTNIRNSFSFPSDASQTPTTNNSKYFHHKAK